MTLAKLGGVSLAVWQDVSCHRYFRAPCASRLRSAFIRKRVREVIQPMVIELRSDSCIEPKQLGRDRKSIIALRSFDRLVTVLRGNVGRGRPGTLVAENRSDVGKVPQITWVPPAFGIVTMIGSRRAGDYLIKPFGLRQSRPAFG